MGPREWAIGFFRWAYQANPLQLFYIKQKLSFTLQITPSIVTSLTVVALGMRAV
jgi:hypothetical protein